MSVVTGVRDWLARTGLEILGWILVPVGIVMMPAPGPGTLVLLGGIALLARSYTWAERVLDWLEHRAIEAAKFGVATWPRIAFSALGCVWLVALGFIWWIGPDIPEFTVAELTIDSAVVTIGFWLAVALVSIGAIIVLRGLLRAGDGLRIAIVAAAWIGGLWFVTTHRPDLGDRPVEIAFGPELPAAGWGTAVAIWFSAALATGLLVFSVAKWHRPQVARPVTD